jgi:hypothetical protein
MPFLYQIVLGMLCSATDLNLGDQEELVPQVDKGELAPLEALEEELREREGFRYARGDNSATTRRGRHERVSFYSKIT